MKKIQEKYAQGRKEWLRGMHLDALGTFRSIIEAGHGGCAANMNSAVILASLGMYEEADAHFRVAFENCPDDPELLFNYSLYLLSRGETDKGLKFYESRSWNIRPPGKEWGGEDCNTLLVVPEQGNGDVIQFARFLSHARKKCKRLILMCFGCLVRLMKSVEGPDEIIEFNPGDEFVEGPSESEGDASYDRFTRIMSIPHLAGVRSFGSKPYLKPDPELVEKWSSEVRGDELKVGLCWQGGKRPKEDSLAIDARRSMSLESICPILDVKGAKFYSLQKEGSEKDERIIDLMGSVSDFADTAAIIQNLDLVITVDTAVAHVAGAIGKPTWILNRKDSCWRWGFEGCSTTWYDNTRLFRQKEMMNWAPVVAAAAEALKEKIDRRDRVL